VNMSDGTISFENLEEFSDELKETASSLLKDSLGYMKF